MKKSAEKLAKKSKNARDTEWKEWEYRQAVVENSSLFPSQPRGSGSAASKKVEKMFLTNNVQFGIIIKLSQNSGAKFR